MDYRVRTGKTSISPEMQAITDIVFPTLDYALEHPDDYFFMHPALAHKIGRTMADIAGTIAFRQVNQKVSNIMIKNAYWGLLSLRTIQRHLSALEKIDLIQAHFMEPEEIVSLLKEKNLKGQGIGNQICTWCGYGALSLDAHHYPEHKKDGGQDTVNICQNCHKEYHYLAGQAGRPAFFYYQVNIEKYKKLLGAGSVRGKIDV